MQPSFPSERVVEAAADAVLRTFQGESLTRENVLRVARLALRTAWFRPYVIKQNPKPETVKPNGRNPYVRWCAYCAATVEARYTSHPVMPGVNAMLCPSCGEVTRPIIQ